MLKLVRWPRKFKKIRRYLQAVSHTKQKKSIPKGEQREWKSGNYCIPPGGEFSKLKRISFQSEYHVPGTENDKRLTWWCISIKFMIQREIENILKLLNWGRPWCEEGLPSIRHRSRNQNDIGLLRSTTGS